MIRTRIANSVFILLCLFGIASFLVSPEPSYAECCSCTCYAWAKRSDLRSICTRDAKFWDEDARNAGYPVGKTPKVGAIVVFEPGVQGADRQRGHVAYVKEVYSSSSFKISEKGWYGGGHSPCEVHFRTAYTEEGVSFIYKEGPVIAKHSGKCLDVSGGSRSNGADVIQWNCHGGDNQLWRLVPAAGGYFRIIAKHSGKCLDVSGGSRSNGADVIQWNCHGGDNQRWKLQPPTPGPGLRYQAHVAGLGWLGWVGDGEVSGTTGQSRQMEAVRIRLENAPAGVRIKYRAHVAGLGWLNWVHNGDIAGTMGQSRRMEAVQIQLEGNPASIHVCYQAHVAGYGWLNWVCDGATAGTTGQSRRMEALRVRLQSR